MAPTAHHSGSCTRTGQKVLEKDKGEGEEEGSERCKIETRKRIGYGLVCRITVLSILVLPYIGPTSRLS